MAAIVHRSPLPDIQLVTTDLVSYLHSNHYNAPRDRPIYVDPVSRQHRTYEDVETRTRSLAHGLRKLGVEPDDAVAIFSPNSIDYAIICFAILGCGATVCPMSAALTQDEIRSQLKTSRAKFIVACVTLMDIAKQALQGTQTRGIIQLNGSEASEGCITSVETLATTYTPVDLVQTPRELLNVRPAFICFSSGTTGPAKGVIITHQNMTANLQQWERLYYHDVKPSPAIIAFVPFGHIYGINVFVCGGFLRGQTTIVMSRFDPKVYLSSIESYKPVELHLVPPIALLLVNDALVDKYDISSVRRILSAAAPMSSELSLALEKRFKGRYGTTVHCHQSWGMTETSPLGTGVPPDRLEKRQTVGCIAPNMELRFVDPETMQDVQEGDLYSESKSAEILCRGPNVTTGYVHNPTATEGAFYTDEQGKKWLKTGDIATIDKDGFLVIRDRIKEMIKYKGLQVIPSELEGKLQEHPDVEDCGVTSFFDAAQATELPLAFVVLKHHAQRDQPNVVKARIHQWLNAKVANHKKLRGGIEFIDQIPKSPSGKILRRKLRESFESRKKAAKL